MNQNSKHLIPQQALTGIQFSDCLEAFNRNNCLPIPVPQNAWAEIKLWSHLTA